MKHRINVMVLLMVAVGLIPLSCRSQAININLTFQQLSGLVKDDRVLFEDNAIGHVQSVQYNSDGRYSVQIAVDKGFTHAVTQYSQFSIVADNKRPDHKAVKVVLTQEGGTPLKNGTTVAGMPAEDDFLSQLQKDIESGFAFFKEQIEKIESDVRQYPQSEDYKNLKKSLEDLAAEIKQKEKQAREKVKQEWLPKIQRELDQLREKLKQYGREDELKPLEKEVDRIRKI